MTVSLPEAASARGSVKSPTAFRTIAEVAIDLDLPAHVLRFWESKFPQIKPLKRRGGRRYYRPEDVALLRRIRSLLYTEGYTIKGVQRLLREGGARGGADRAGDDEESEAAPGAAAADAAEAAEHAAEPRHATPESDEDLLRQVLADLEAIRALLREHGY